MISLEDVHEARRRIHDSVFLSPCSPSAKLSEQTGTRCWLKLENLQMTGSFKERGACNKLVALSASERERGVICASAGNHALGVAYHATRLGIDATIVMPEATPLIKVQGTRKYGARVVLEGSSFDEAHESAVRIQQVEGRTFVHPFDDDLIMAGQGTIGLELLEQAPSLDAVVVGVGGGGLAAGVAVALKGVNPNVKVYGVESVQCASMREAVRVGSPVTIPVARTIAEGLAARRVGDRTLEVCRRYVDDMVIVDEEEIAEAILVLLEQEKTVAEGAGAAPLAALLNKRIPGVFGKNVAVVVCGGNIDVGVVSRIIERGLAKSGRMARFSVKIPDMSGALARLSKIIWDCRANIIQIHHDRTFCDTELNEAMVQIVVETRGFDHVLEVKRALTAEGYPVDGV